MIIGGFVENIILVSTFQIRNDYNWVYILIYFGMGTHRIFGITLILAIWTTTRKPKIYKIIIIIYECLFPVLIWWGIMWVFFEKFSWNHELLLYARLKWSGAINFKKTKVHHHLINKYINKSKRAIHSFWWWKVCFLPQHWNNEEKKLLE